MRPYNGPPKLKLLPHLKKNYRGMNKAGGRKAVFAQSRIYPARQADHWYNKVLLQIDVDKQQMLFKEFPRWDRGLATQ